MRRIRVSGRPGKAGVILVPTEFDTIQEAVNNATAGDTIQVAAGIYCEHVVVPQSLTIIGEHPQTTIVDGTANGTVFDLEGSNIHITGFTVRNAGNSHNAITSEKELVTNDYHRIVNNIIATSQYGVSLAFSKSNIIFNNTFIDNPFAAIYLYRADNTNITANNVAASAYGVKIVSSLNNIIIGNTFAQTSYAIHLTASSSANPIRGNVISGKTVGIYSSSDSIIIDHNTITNGAYGIYLYNCKTSFIYYNMFINNSYGIRLYMPAPTATNHNVKTNKIVDSDWAIELVYANNNTFTGNWIQQNTYGLYMSSSSSNTIHRNNFVQNSMQAYAGTGTGNLWDKDGEGNFWSDYDGQDPDGDGIGNTSYRIIPLGYDNYPLMDTWSEHDVSIENMTLSADHTHVGQPVNVTVTLKNKGQIGASETFNVTAKYDSETIETKEVIDLAAGANTTLTFSWNTTGVPYGIRTVSAEIIALPEEYNTDNNNYPGSPIYVILPGDINVDGAVNIDDLILLDQAYGATSSSPNWNSDADLNNDDLIDAVDLFLLGKYCGKTA
jgi:parallel beta-helix repeat protein